MDGTMLQKKSWLGLIHLDSIDLMQRLMLALQCPACSCHSATRWQQQFCLQASDTSDVLTTTAA
jgi:hypothetical protein